MILMAIINTRVARIFMYMFNQKTRRMHFTAYAHALSPKSTSATRGRCDKRTENGREWPGLWVCRAGSSRIATVYIYLLMALRCELQYVANHKKY